MVMVVSEKVAGRMKGAGWIHAREREVLTPELLAALQRHDTGIIGMLAREVERLRRIVETEKNPSAGEDGCHTPLTS